MKKFEKLWENLYYYYYLFIYFLGQLWLKKFWSLLIDDPFNDGFWVKISIFFQLNEMRDEAKTWWVVSGSNVA